jgi:LacI family transcriptional regulator, fructose operon transcriptional repressor
MTSIKDVAKKAGVSVATVSRVLANKPHVRPEIREQVLRVVKESGYRPSRIASSMRNQSSRIIGVMISDIRNPFFTAIARAIEDSANRQEMSIFLCNTDENHDKEELYLHTLLQERVAGVILSPTRETTEPFDALLKSDIPTVAIDRRIDGANIDGVYSDNVVSAQLLTSHLLENGYKRIGAIFGLKDSMTGRERMEGYRLALAEHSIQFDPSFACYAHPLEGEGEKIVSQWLKADYRLDAILTGNSRLTIGALNAISAAGLIIPHDIALAGFDETSWMRHAGPGITVICQPTYEIGRTAAELLFQRMADPTRPRREVVLKDTLIRRGSTAQKV